MEYYHSVTLDKSRCIGCTNCLKRCPTEAIRIRDNHAVILDERCIDCGECIHACPWNAKVAITDGLDILGKHKYNIALPAPALFPQFKDVHDAALIIEGLFGIGFDHVFESAIGAGIISAAIKEKLATAKGDGPLISSACPAIVKLIQVSYPSLIENIVDVISPMEAAANVAKEEFCSKNGVSPEDVGVIYITPCSAKMTAIKTAPGMEKSGIDGAVSIQTIYGHMVSSMPKSAQRLVRRATAADTSWAVHGGETSSLVRENTLAVDGIDNVMQCLEEIDNMRFSDLKFFEGRACTGGCIGGPLTVENSFVAKNRMRKILDRIPSDIDNSDLSASNSQLSFTKELEPSNIFQFGGTLNERLSQMDKMNRIVSKLPGLDCGSCGSPTCRTLAEDIVRGYATELNCIFKMKDRVALLAEQMLKISSSTRFIKAGEKDEEDAAD